jgi:hypothetical protein
LIFGAPGTVDGGGNATMRYDPTDERFVGTSADRTVEGDEIVLKPKEKKTSQRPELFIRAGAFISDMEFLMFDLTIQI